MGLRGHALHKQVTLVSLLKPSREVLERLYEIEVSAHESAWSFDTLQDSINEDTQCIALVVGTEIMGFALFSVVCDEAELYTIGVQKKYQGLGFGRKLLHGGLNYVAQQGALNCYLEVRVSNEVALYLYDCYGFKITGTRKNYYPATSTMPSENAYTMACDLTALEEGALPVITEHVLNQNAASE